VAEGRGNVSNWETERDKFNYVALKRKFEPAFDTLLEAWGEGSVGTWENNRNWALGIFVSEPDKTQKMKDAKAAVDKAKNEFDVAVHDMDKAKDELFNAMDELIKARGL
jgi:hypothetical protein